MKEIFARGVTQLGNASIPHSGALVNEHFFSHSGVLMLRSRPGAANFFNNGVDNKYFRL